MLETPERFCVNDAVSIALEGGSNVIFSLVSQASLAIAALRRGGSENFAFAALQVLSDCHSGIITQIGNPQITQITQIGVWGAADVATVATACAQMDRRLLCLELSAWTAMVGTRCDGPGALCSMAAFDAATCS